MSENKRFYWLKLNEDFFDDDTIRYIEEQENGVKYSNFYLKLCLKSLRTDGRLIRLVGEILIPYDVKSLSALTGVDVDTVRCAMALFEKIGCVKMLDSGELYISQLAEMVGSETDKAKLMRASRAREKAGNDVTRMLPGCYTEKEIEKEKDTELETEQKTEGEKGRKRPPARFVPPTLEEVQEYARSRKSDVDPKKFWDYFDAGDWKDSEGKPVKSWKQKFITWENKGRKGGNSNAGSNAAQQNAGAYGTAERGGYTDSHGNHYKLRSALDD